MSKTLDTIKHVILSEAREETNWVHGHQLHPDDQKHVLSAYVHRFTGEHKPQWAHKTLSDGSRYREQHATDKDWLHNTKFAVKKNGRLHQGVRRCESTPTWPRGEGFDKPTDIKEETVTELSARTMSAYTQKALPSAGNHNFRAGVAHAMGDDKDSEKHLKKAMGRELGVTRAVRKTLAKEEVVTELSRKTLANYTRTAATDMGELEKIGKYHNDWERFEKDRNAHPSTITSHAKAADKAYHKQAMRRVGIDRSTQRLAKEENITELSKKTLGSYIKRSSIDMYNTGTDVGTNTEKTRHTRPKNSEYHWRQISKDSLRANKRSAGISNAVRRLTKEEIELDEAIKKGAFHRWLGKSEDQPITAADIKKGLAAGGHAAKMANFARNTDHIGEAVDPAKENAKREWLGKFEGHVRKAGSRVEWAVAHMLHGDGHTPESAAAKYLKMPINANKKQKVKEEVVTELSKKTLGTYVKRATSNLVRKRSG